MDDAVADEAATDLLGVALRLGWLLAGELHASKGGHPTLRQFRVLHRLAQRPHRAGELATSTQVTAASITQLADVMQRQGWVQRSADPGDGRATLLSLTPAGEKILLEAEIHLHALLREVVGNLGAEELSALSALAPELHAGIDLLRVSLNRGPDGIPGRYRLQARQAGHR